jgi:hypothetical protein
MIRFIDLRGQGIGHRFAFWDTGRDQFYEFCSEQAWDTKAEFIEACEYSIENYHLTDHENGYKRFTNLMPDWADAPAIESESFFHDETQSHEIP